MTRTNGHSKVVKQNSIFFIISTISASVTDFAVRDMDSEEDKKAFMHSS